MPEKKNATLNIQAGTSMQLKPTLLSSDAVVRAISSHVLNVAVAGRVTISAAVSLDLVDSATGQVVKSISSFSSEVISDPALPADARAFFQTPLGSNLLTFLLNAILTVSILLYQQHSEEVSQRKTEQFVKQMAQSVEQFFLSHSEQATPTPAHTPPQGD